jgi:hypothetical protein
MSANERTDPKAGPFVNLSQTYCNGLDVVAKSYEPVLKSAGRVNLEVVGYMTRRASAWLEIPARASQCKTPQDLVREQMQFWQTAAQDYSESVRRLTAAFGAFAPPGFNVAWGSTTTAPTRDYITFAEQKAAAPDQEPKRERRAA